MLNFHLIEIKSWFKLHNQLNPDYLLLNCQLYMLQDVKIKAHHTQPNTDIIMTEACGELIQKLPQKEKAGLD